MKSNILVLYCFSFAIFAISNASIGRFFDLYTQCNCETNANCPPRTAKYNFMDKHPPRNCTIGVDCPGRCGGLFNLECKPLVNVLCDNCKKQKHCSVIEAEESLLDGGTDEQLNITLPIDIPFTLNASVSDEVKDNIETLLNAKAHENTSFIHNPCQPEWVYYSGTNRCFYIGKSDSFISMLDSQQECTKLESKLASVHSKEENAFLEGLMKDSPNRAWAWLGAIKRDGKWQWLDDTPWDYQYWDTELGEPNGDGTCSHMWPNNNGAWNDMPCENINWNKQYICVKTQNTSSGS